MSGLEMDMPNCDYCSKAIDYHTDTVIETRVADSGNLIELTHSKCWVAMDTVCKTIIQSAIGILQDGVDNKSPVM